MSFVLDVLVPETILRICVLSYDLQNGKSSNDGEAESRPTEQQVYDEAVKKVEVLAADDVTRRWTLIAADLDSARRTARKELGLTS